MLPTVISGKKIRNVGPHAHIRGGIMKKSIMIIISLSCLQISFALGNGPAFAFSPSTGDKVLDSRLDAVNAHAAKNQDAFVTKLSATYHVDQAKIQGMLQQGIYSMLSSYLSMSTITISVNLCLLSIQPIGKKERVNIDLNEPNKL